MQPERVRAVVGAARCLVAAGLFAAAVVALAGVAAAQEGQAPSGVAEGEEKPKSDQPVMVAGFGWGNVIPADRWSPVTVYVTTGEKPVSGTIVMEYMQDATQTASIAVPFAATPNRTTPVQIVAALPSMCDRVTFMMYSESGRLLRTLVYTSIATSMTAQLPPMVDGSGRLIVAVGRSTLGDAARDWKIMLGAAGVGAAAGAANPLERAGWEEIETGRAAPDELPIAWAAYDGLAALVVHPEGFAATGRSADPRAVQAIHEWVRSGGRLIVLADAPGDGWRAWLPAEALAALVVDPVTHLPAPEEVGAAIDRARRDTARVAELAPEGSGPALEVPPVAGELRGRPLGLSSGAAAAGWTLRWKSAGPGEAAADEAPKGFLAEGPCGYGLVTVLGLDPANAPTTLSTRATGAVWRSALSGVLADHLAEAAAASKARQTRGWGWHYGPEQRATNTALERLSDVPTIGDWAFLLIAGCVGLLAAMVGPVDYFVLRRLRAGQRSWLTALLWIVAASLLAYSAPRALRTSPTVVNRVTVVDRMLPAQGYVATAEGPEPLTYAVGMTGLYAGESGRLRFTNPDPISWWRGTSIRYEWLGMHQEGGAVAVVPTVQAAAGGAAGSERGNPLTDLPMGLWTFRTLTDLSRPRAGSALAVGALTARVRETPEGLRAEVAGLPPGVMVTDAALRAGEGWHALVAPRPEPPPKPPPVAFTPRVIEPEERAAPELPRAVGEAGDSTWAATFPERYRSAKPPKTWTNPEPDPNNYYVVNPMVNKTPGPMLDLPGAGRRGLAIEQRVASGKWAAVYLSVSGFPLDTPVGWPSRSDHTCVVRLLVPLEGEGR